MRNVRHLSCHRCTLPLDPLGVYWTHHGGQHLGTKHFCEECMSTVLWEVAYEADTILTGLVDQVADNISRLRSRGASRPERSEP